MFAVSSADRSLSRTIEVTGAEMHYRLDMAAGGQDLQFDFEATFRRAD